MVNGIRPTHGKGLNKEIGSIPILNRREPTLMRGGRRIKEPLRPRRRVAQLRVLSPLSPHRAHARFLQYVYDFLSAVRSSLHHLFMYGDGRDRGQYLSKALFTHGVSRLAISSTSWIGNVSSFACSTASLILSHDACFCG